MNSPEHDGKLFGHDDDIFLGNHTHNHYYHQWRTINSPTWTGQPLLPTHLTDEERHTAEQEFKALPEHFYTNRKDLPVITPDACAHFLDVMTTLKPRPHITLWSWCSGSSRLTYTMSSMPFSELVLFPVDLRYGWDIRLPEHQLLLQRVDALLRPHTTTMEPRCKYWSKAGSRRAPEVTEERRQS